MEFNQMNEILQNHFNKITKDAVKLFEVEVDKDEMWNLYLDSFEKKYNPIYRQRRVHDCSCCRQFIKSIGNVVVIKDNEMYTVWDVHIQSDEYSPVFKVMSEYIKSKNVTSVFLIDEKFTSTSKLENHRRVGTPFNFEQLEDGSSKKWEHYSLDLNKSFINSGRETTGTVKGSLNSIKSVFKRSLDELTIESVETVLELIYSNTLYKGEEWKQQLEMFLQHKNNYFQLSDKEKELYAWEQSVRAGGVIGKIRNHSIGTLLINISEGMDLDTAVKKYESIVAPHNYKRPKAIFTKKMLEEAQETVTQLGYINSLGRRYATLDDITVNNILFSNRDSAKRMSESDIFGEMSKDIAVNPKQFSRVEEISLEKFVSDVLPHAKELELFLENKHKNNMVSLIAPLNKDSKTMFKWENNFSWAYSGNITDSSMKENVKSAGGSVTGDLRFSIQWNDICRDSNDLDAHCLEPSGFEIMYSRKVSQYTKGELDVDIITPREGIPSVENITYEDRKHMQDGEYQFFVHYFSGRPNNGFRAEIEFDGNVYSFESKDNNPSNRIVKVATVALKDGVFTIKEHLESSLSVKEVWGIKTQQFVPISVVMNSPNYWNEQIGIGHKHVFFMLKDCINSEMPNGFYNEFLKEDLMKHKRVFEALGSKMRVESVEDQLSGVGFSTTKRSEVILKVKGITERVMKVKF